MYATAFEGIIQRSAKVLGAQPHTHTLTRARGRVFALACSPRRAIGTLMVVSPSVLSREPQCTHARTPGRQAWCRKCRRLAHTKRMPAFINFPASQCVGTWHGHCLQPTSPPTHGPPSTWPRGAARSQLTTTTTPSYYIKRNRLHCVSRRRRARVSQLHECATETFHKWSPLLYKLGSNARALVAM